MCLDVLLFASTMTDPQYDIVYEPPTLLALADEVIVDDAGLLHCTSPLMGTTPTRADAA